MSRTAARTSLAVCVICVCGFISFAKPSAQDAANPGADVYAKRCSSCHDQGAVRVPSRSVLQQRTSAYILKTLTTGIMKEQAAPLSAQERMAVAQWLGRTTAVGIDPAKISHPCSAPAAVEAAAASWTSWGAGLANLRFQSAAFADLDTRDVGRLHLKWAFGVPDVTAMRSQPVVFAGRVLFAGGAMLYSVDAATGCTHWATELPSPARSGIAIGSPAGRNLAFFGDSSANVHAVDVATGAPVWQTHVDKHPAALITGTPVYHDGKLYVPVASYEEAVALAPGYVCCTFRGSILALDASSGQILWQTFTIDHPATGLHTNKLGSPAVGPSGAGVWSAPTIDTKKNLLYVGTGDNYSDPPTALSDAVLALALDTGKIVWSHQFRAGDAFNEACVLPGPKNCPDAAGPDFDFGASPLLLSRPNGHRALILAQKSGAVYAIDPDKEGKLLWQAQLGTGGVLGGVEWGPASDSERLYVAISDEAFVPGPPPGLDPDKGGGLFALSLEKGNRLWSAQPSPCDARRPCSPAQTAAITAIPGVVFSGSLNGHFRAYSAADGKVLWDYDTGHEFTTVNNVPAHGGSMSVAGPVVAGGTVYVLSGYDTFGEAPGNVLLAFSVDGQ
jgi:polyvinyl alcohol dehydrogenase (cytochrome)